MATDGSITSRIALSKTAAISAANPHRQKRMGPAPFASFEDLSDEVRSRLESPDEKTSAGSVVRLPGIREDITPSSPAYTMSQTPELVYTGISLVGQAKTPVNPSTSFADAISAVATSAKLQAPNTPRIDISRASSSSHHDSKESSPDREVVGEKYDSTRDHSTTKLGVGFREDGTLDLRSSTEELDFQDQKDLEKNKNRSRPQSPSCLYDDSYQNHVRKDSQCSEISLLAISGRTSRLSSIGSAGSAQSRLSNASHLSVLSGTTELSRSPSPHKMLLETSFCGTKSPKSMSSATIDNIGTKADTDHLEKILLSRKHDPTEAILAEGIIVAKGGRSSSMRQAPEKPVRRNEKRVQSVKSDITIKVDTPPLTDSNATPRQTKKVIAESGIEYIYIPLKGPLPLDFEEHKISSLAKSVSKAVSHTEAHTKSSTQSKSKNKPNSAPLKLGAPHSQTKHKDISSSKDLSFKSAEVTSVPPSTKKNEPKYIRIKLKPDHLYDDDDTSNTSPETKLDKIDLDEIKTDDSTTGTYDTGKSLASTPSVSPKFSRHCVVKDYNLDSKTPSPSLSRKSSFASIFKSKEAITSPESPTVPGKRKNTITCILRDASESLRDRSRSRSRSKGREQGDKSLAVSNTLSSTESIDSRGKQKRVFSIFRSPKGDPNRTVSCSSEIVPDRMEKLEFQFNSDQKFLDKMSFEKPLEAKSIRIPLHSPTHYENENHRFLKDMQTPSQDSQETVIEVAPAKQENTPDISNQASESAVKIATPEYQSRQSSTSSENVVFSTKVGSSNEIFTTKLPKKSNTEFKLPKNDEKKKIKGQVCTDLSQEFREVSKKVIEEVPKEANTEKFFEGPPKTEVKIERTSSITNFKKILEENQKPVLVSNETILGEVISQRHKQNKHFFREGDKHDSTESEKDSEASSVPSSIQPKNDAEVTELLKPEFKSLVIQDSFEDELPYVPTTLPLERSAAIPIVPVKQRSTFEVRTCPIDRPRSTTPINPSSLEDYCEEVVDSKNPEIFIKSIEKLKISLPKAESGDKPLKSPKKPRNTTWFEFAEKGIHTGRKSSTDGDTAPPLPPKDVQTEWINFEEVPERRKLPKRIQIIPSRGHIDVPENVLHDHVVYNYVNPEECKCECHDKKDKKNEESEEVMVQDDEVPLLDEPDEEKIVNTAMNKIKLSASIAERGSLISDSSVDLSTHMDPPEEIQYDGSLQTPFKTDLDVSSNRSSIGFLEEPSHCSESPNASSKPS